MKKLSVALSLLLLLFVLASAKTAKADNIGTLTLSNCGTAGTNCPGAIYKYDITNTSATLTVKITGAPNTANDFIGSVDLGFAPSKAISGLSLTAAPSALSNWKDTTGSLNSSGNGCGANGGAFICATALPLTPLSIAQNGVYTWTWSFNPISASLVTQGSSVHVGTQYGPNSANNWKGLIVSQVASGSLPVSEPASMFIMGAGLLALGGFAKRFRKSAA